MKKAIVMQFLTLDFNKLHIYFFLRRSNNKIDTNNMAATEKENNRIFQPNCLINGFVTILTRGCN
jgi:hypothetical protein